MLWIPAALQDVRRQFRQLGALAFLQLDVRGDRLVPKPADDVVEPVGRGIHVGIVDLVGIPGEDDFGAVTIQPHCLPDHKLIARCRRPPARSY